MVKPLSKRLSVLTFSSEVSTNKLTMDILDEENNIKRDVNFSYCASSLNLPNA
jgi:hypothetical protein